MSDYAVTAQFYDAVALGHHGPLGSALAEALRGLETSQHPVVDIGAGTGLSTRLIAEILPDAEILAVEPDPAMRCALMTRVSSDVDLKRRVSILPMSILAAPLPPRISAAVACASLVHFDPQQRKELWALLSSRLLPGGRAVLELQCPVAQDVSETCVATVEVGQVTYESWASARRLDDQRQLWSLRYLSRWRGREIDSQRAEYVCWVVSAEQLLLEAAACGLAGSSTESLVILRTASAAD